MELKLLLKLLRLKILVFLFFNVVWAVSGGQKSVVVSLHSRWPQTSILLEASEFLAKESEQQFWSFVDSIAVYSENAEKPLQAFSDKELYEFLRKESAKIVSPARLDLLKLSLSLRSHSPAVEMYRQIAIHSDSTEKTAEQCKIFVELHGRSTCNLSQLDSLLESANEKKAAPVFNMDHHFPGSKAAGIVVVLYADLADPEFSDWHKTLKRKAETREIDYIFRHYIQNPPNERVILSGYGVELAIKSTEYKAQDDSKIRANITEGGAVVEEEEEEDLSGFNFKVLKQLHPDLKDSLQELKLHLLEADELTPLKVWQLQDLSFQAGQRVVNVEKREALRVLQDISQNFPLMARSLTRTEVKSEFRKEVEKNQAESLEEMGISPGESALFINGLLVDMDSLDVYQLLDTLKKEEKLSAGFFRMGFRREYLSVLLSLDLRDEQMSYAIDYRPGYPQYINDLDKDPQYREWGNSVRLILQPYFPGMIRPIARNFFTLIFLVDPSTREGRNLLKIGYSFYVHEIPIRAGFVFVVNTDRSVTGQTDAGVALLNLFNFVKGDQNSVGKGLSAVTDVFDFVQEEGRETTPEDVLNYFKKKFPGEDADLVFGEDSDYDDGRQAGASFLESSGLGEAPKVLLNGIPLDDSGISADRFEETVIGQIMKITPKIQKAVQDGKLTDSMNVQEFILNQPDVMPRLNSRILGGSKEKNSEKKKKFLDFTDVMEYKAKNVKEFSVLPLLQQNAFMVKQMKYLKRSEDLGIRPVTFWVVADLETVGGRQLYYNAVKQLKHSHNMRLGLIHNPNMTGNNEDSDVNVARLVEAAIRLLPMNHGKMFATKLVKEENVEALRKKTTTLEDLEVYGMNMASFKKELRLMSDEFLKLHSYYATKVLELLPGERAIVANGQVIGPLGQNEEFLTEDFGVLEKFVLAQSAQSVAEQIKAWEVEDEEEKSSDLVMRVCSLVLSDPIRKRRHWVALQDDQHSSVTIPASDETTATFDVVAVVDPLSREAQKMAPLLIVLNAVINADLKLVMNSKPKLSEMPLKSFYRLVLEPELEFTLDGSLKKSPYARFSALPQKQLLTLNVIPPEAWLVESVKALYDLDNIRMELVESTVTAEYELEYLLLEGHCFDEVTGNPPRGLQFTLGTDKNPVMVDTIVMANLGYFQLKASPGAWVLRLREGKSAEIYDITTHYNTDSSFTSQDVTVIMDSFNGRIIRIRVAKKPDKIQENLLSDGKESGEEESIWQTISSKFTSGEIEEEDPTLNIFSLASGHLYERFIRIMMLSVIKKASKPVKFWLLKNYLSPSFKKFLPYMAEHYGISFELVQYKWPRWLHQQTEKQRVMWGYKILFLDVLFPLDVRKVIFVDADQVVRVDMTELIRLDLEGAPYGYTPFCDSRKEMEGFRFWKSGYWANHLGYRKYHISALYVVDLMKFRKIAAGDRLRGQYQGLSADPNSLSNLDQDLPNNMIHQVKIKSLPQDWLWCETWCDDNSKASAKTIDLCNNPQTKEPKLESAMRIIPEWKDLDSEIKNLQERYEQGVPAKSPDTYAPGQTGKDPKKDEHKHTDL